MKEKTKFKIAGLIALLIILSIIFFSIINSWIIEPKKSIEPKYINLNATAAQQRLALQEVAEAYYRKGTNVQYCSHRKQFSKGTPEDATDDKTVYMVCSSFTYNVYKNALGIEIPYSTGGLIDFAQRFKDEEYVVEYFESNDELYEDTKYDTWEKFESNIAKRLRVGDLIVVIMKNGTTGHVMMVDKLIYENNTVVDAWLIHSSGSEGFEDEAFDENSDSDNLESGTNSDTGDTEGSIKKEKFSTKWSERHIASSGKGYTWYSNKMEMGIIRPIAKETTYKEPYVQLDSSGNRTIAYRDTAYGSLTASASTRNNYSRLDIDKTSNKHYNIVSLGDSITYTIKIKNTSENTYTGSLLVKENISDLVEVTDAGGGSLSNGVLTWTVSPLTSGETNTITYTVKVKNDSSNMKKTITSTGTVGNIKSATITNNIGKALTTSQRTKLKDAATSLINSSNKTGVDFVNQVYEQALGTNPNITLGGLKIKDEIIANNTIVTTTDTGKKISSMVLNKQYGTYKYTTTINSRVSNYLNGTTDNFTDAWDARLKAKSVRRNDFVVGDVILVEEGSTEKAYIVTAIDENGRSVFSIVGKNSSGGTEIYSSIEEKERFASSLITKTGFIVLDQVDIPESDATSPQVTVTRSDYNTFRWTASDDVGVTGYGITTTNTQPTTWITSRNANKSETMI